MKKNRIASLLGFNKRFEIKEYNIFPTLYFSGGSSALIVPRRPGVTFKEEGDIQKYIRIYIILTVIDLKSNSKNFFIQ